MSMSMSMSMHHGLVVTVTEIRIKLFLYTLSHFCSLKDQSAVEIIKRYPFFRTVL